MNVDPEGRKTMRLSRNQKPMGLNYSVKLSIYST